jgi:hypothetical protein
MGCNCKTPGVVTMAANAAAAVYRIAAATAQNEAIKVEPETLKARMAICLQCEFMTVSANGLAHRCNQCGCWLDGNVLCKACLKTESCPLNKWEAA